MRGLSRLFYPSKIKSIACEVLIFFYFNKINLFTDVLIYVFDWLLLTDLLHLGTFLVEPKAWLTRLLAVKRSWSSIQTKTANVIVEERLLPLPGQSRVREWFLGDQIPDSLVSRRVWLLSTFSYQGFVYNIRIGWCMEDQPCSSVRNAAQLTIVIIKRSLRYECWLSGMFVIFQSEPACKLIDVVASSYCREEGGIGD